MKNMKTKNKGGFKNRTEKLRFDELSMTEAKENAETGKVVIIPVGSVEEHGKHLPLCTDSLQPEYIALRVAKITRCLVAPSLSYGVCNSTRNFPGTISIRFESLYMIVRDILEEFIRNGFVRLLILSGHAGESHMTALRLATQEVMWKHEKQNPKRRLRIMVCSDYDFAYELKGKYFSEKDGHAGAIETSRIMAIRPDLTGTKGKKSFPQFPRFEIVADPERYFPSGVIGDPTTASPRKGKMINQYVTKEVAKLVEELKSS